MHRRKAARGRRRRRRGVLARWRSVGNSCSGKCRDKLRGVGDRLVPSGKTCSTSWPRLLSIYLLFFFFFPYVQTGVSKQALFVASSSVIEVTTGNELHRYLCLQTHWRRRGKRRPCFPLYFVRERLGVKETNCVFWNVVPYCKINILFSGKASFCCLVMRQFSCGNSPLPRELLRMLKKVCSP